MLLREIFESILLEYNREKTAATFGNKILKAFIVDRSIGRYGLGQLQSYLIQKEKTKVPNEPETPKDLQNKTYIINDILGIIEDYGDPTQHKEYSQWLVKCYANEGIILEDIVSKGKDWLEIFIQMKVRKILPAEYRNIMNLKFNDLYGVVSNEELVAKLQAQSEEVNKGNSTVLLDNAEVRIIKPENQEAACYYGQGTTWCTAAKNNNMYDYYARTSDLYILLPKKPAHDGEKYQIHFDSNQFMNEGDDPVDMIWLIKQRFGDLLPFFEQYEKNLGKYIQFADPNVVSKIVADIKEIAIQQVYEILSDWETGDDYYYDWLHDQGYVDKDGDIDWDLVEKDGVSWLDYNDAAREWYNKANDALSPTLKDLSDTISDFFDNREEYPTIFDLDRLIGGYIEQEFASTRRNSSDLELGQWVHDNIVIRPEGDGYKVTKIHEK